MMTNIKYPIRPNIKSISNRSNVQLDYLNMISDKLFDYDPSFEFKTLKYDQMVGKQWTVKYHGQINPKTKKPDGIGIGITKDGLIIEGIFKNDQYKGPYLIHKYDTSETKINKFEIILKFPKFKNNGNYSVDILCEN